jgi:RNA polymerase sigma-70 factor (ECF subfamily)
MTVRRQNGRVASGTPSIATDAEIMSRLARGDTSALGELYDRYAHAIRGFLARATAGGHDVDDLAHATFLAAAESAGRYDGRLSCRPWLIGIAAQLIRRRRQASGRFFAFLSSFGGVRAASIDPGPAMQARNDVERALLAITPPKRVTFLMAEVEGLTCPEIAEALRIPIGTVWTRLHAARRELRRALEAKES